MAATQRTYASTAGVFPSKPDMARGKMETIINDLTAGFTNIISSLTSTKPPKQKEVAYSLDDLKNMFMELKTWCANMVTSMEMYVSNVERVIKENNASIEKSFKNSSEFQTIRRDQRLRDENFLVRQIVLCLENNIVEDIRTAELAVSSKYKGRTFKHLHHAAFKADADYPFVNPLSKKIYTDFLQQWFQSASRDFSLDLADCSQKLKKTASDLAHEIPKEAEQDLNAYKAISISTSIDMPVAWTTLLDVAKEVSQKKNRPLLYQIELA